MARLNRAPPAATQHIHTHARTHCRLSTHLQHGHIKGATTQVKHQDALVGLLVKAVGQGGSGGLVDDTQHVQASDLASILGGLCGEGAQEEGKTELA